jgi:hypothetical protein
MNVVNVQKDELGIRVGIFRLVSPAFGHVCQRVHLRPRVINVDAVGLGVCVHNAGNDLLVLAGPLTRDARQRL